MDSKKVELEKIPHPKEFVTNLEPNEQSPHNILRLVLANKGFHLRFEGDAVDSSGRPIEGVSALYIDDPDEKTKFDSLWHIQPIDGITNFFRGAYSSLILEDMLRKDLDETEYFDDEEKKRLMALYYQKGAESARKHKHYDFAEKKEEALKKLKVEPYTPDMMMRKLDMAVNEVLAAHPELRP